ncbi:MAG: hypothetical protein AAGA69_01770 [Pseudomonadota bacterium]
MTLAKQILLATLAVLSAQMVNAEDMIPTADTGLGEWHAPCDAWGVPATCTTTWSKGKHDSHLVQEYSIVSVADNVPIFSGRGLYRIVDGQVEGVWEDSRGEILQLAGTYENGTLKVIWGDASSEIGRSVYRFADGRMQARDSVLTDDGWREFMAIDYQRTSTPGSELQP